MRYLTLSATLLLATIGTAAAQNNATPAPNQPPVHVPDEGPISGGVFHQPTQGEIQQREHDSKAYQQQQQQESKEVDQLYNQLINPGQAPAKKP
jgi:Spy/CpxP family protein refolding chaperone